MDEADVLGDRIAIMSKGSLKCCGSPLFLKSKYGNGYSLVITKKKASQTESESPKETDEQEANIETSTKVIDLVKSIIPSAQLSSNINSEISFMLPTEETAKFSGLFEHLEKLKETLNILNIGISVTTLEEVFLRIGDNENSDDFDSKPARDNASYINDYSASNPVYVANGESACN